MGRPGCLAEKRLERVFEAVEFRFGADKGKSFLNQFVGHLNLADDFAVFFEIKTGEGVHLVVAQRDNEVTGLFHHKPLGGVAAAVNPIHCAFVQLLTDYLRFHARTPFLVGVSVLFFYSCLFCKSTRKQKVKNISPDWFKPDLSLIGSMA